MPADINLSWIRYQRRFRVPLRTGAGVFHRREGIVLRIESATGTGYGEVAPWRGFSHETVDDCEAFLRENTGTAPGDLTKRGECPPALRFALALAQKPAAHSGKPPPSPIKPLRVAGLLASAKMNDAAALAERLCAKREKGFTVFKIKIGGNTGATPAAIEALLGKLKPGEYLRLDANGALPSLMPWLSVLSDKRVEFIEQPFSPERMASEKFYALPEKLLPKIALDESVTHTRTLPEDWGGVLVIKPLLLGGWSRFRYWRWNHTHTRLIYSSCFETCIGREALLNFANNDTYAPLDAHGLDTLGYFENDVWEVHDTSKPAIASALNWTPQERDAWWENVCAVEANLHRSFHYVPQHDKLRASRTEVIKRMLRKRDMGDNDCANTTFRETLAFLRTVRESAVVIAHSDAARYSGAMLAAFIMGKTVFCANPHWGETEWREANAVIPRDALRIPGDAAVPGAPEGAKQDDSTTIVPALLIPTGGSGGKVRFVAHTADTLRAAAHAQVAAIAGEEISPDGERLKWRRTYSFVAALPPWHISGIMPFFRTLICASLVTCCNGSFADDAPLPEPNGEFNHISLVPTQLARLMERPDGTGIEWLRKFDTILLGGASTPPALLARARAAQLRIAIGYGMTETAAFVALRTPDEFLAGGDSDSQPSAKILPHAKILILDAHEQPVPDGTPGRIAIESTALSPDIAPGADGAPPRFLTQDEGVCEHGRLRVLGRTDRYIVTGGEKVDPRRVEAVLAELPEVDSALVVGEPDAEWGQRITALVVLKGEGAADDWHAPLEKAVGCALARHCIPKRWLRVPKLPFNERGKLDHGALAGEITNYELRITN